MFWEWRRVAMANYGSCVLFSLKWRSNVFLSVRCFTQIMVSICHVEGMGKLDLVDADLINPASGNRSHLERALFHFQQEHIILLRTRLLHLHLECTLPRPPDHGSPAVLFLHILSRCLDPASSSSTSSSAASSSCICPICGH